MMPESRGEWEDYRTPHGLLMAVVMGAVVAGPLFVLDGGEALREALSELLGPVGLPLLPLGLVVLIRVLSSGYRLVDVFGFALGESLDAAYRSGRGSPVGGVISLLLFLRAVYYRSWSPFGGGDDE
uniref:Uncharacterized protein n=1 Tax=Aegilops tauschii TaxID=37682 RepID=R7WFQ9_AEGTA